MKVRDLIFELSKLDLEAEVAIFDDFEAEGPYELETVGVSGCEEVKDAALHFSSEPAPGTLRYENRLSVSWDDNREVVTIEGIKYSYHFFRELGLNGMKVGAITRIEERTEDGNIVLCRPSKAELYKWASKMEDDGSEVEFEVAQEMNHVVKEVLALD
jgi:hypothetical protein